MRRPAPYAQLSSLLLLLSSLLSTTGCGGGRDAHDVAQDLEGTISSATVERVAHDVDLARAPLAVVAGSGVDEHFGANDQPALETFLQDNARQLEGLRVHVSQEVVDDTGGGTQRLSLTLEVSDDHETRYVPVVLDLVRDGRRVLVTRARVLPGSSSAQ